LVTDLGGQEFGEPLARGTVGRHDRQAMGVVTSSPSDDIGVDPSKTAFSWFFRGKETLVDLPLKTHFMDSRTKPRLSGFQHLLSEEKTALARRGTEIRSLKQ
jgi:hypothetical protein